MTSETQEQVVPHRYGFWRRWWKPALLVAGLLLAVYSLRGRLPNPADTWVVVQQASIWWVLVAVLLQFVSMIAFAEQQRHLLAAFGVRMPSRTLLSTSFASTAMSTALPGGAAVAAGYSFRRYRAYGATQPIAAAVMVLSGVASLAGIALLYAADALSWANVSIPAYAILGVALAAAAWFLVRRVRNGPTEIPPARPAPDGGSLIARVRHTVRETATLASVVPGRRWLAALALATVNWICELLCLLAAMHALGLPLSGRTIATGYLFTQLVRQIPVTPGGVGVIEASLVVALTATGIGATPAAAAVLIYRLITSWSNLPIGLVCWMALKRSDRAQETDRDQETDRAQTDRAQTDRAQTDRAQEAAEIDTEAQTGEKLVPAPLGALPPR